jgi:hypothetical protein
MADNSIVGGLFGIDPMQYQMAQQAKQDTQAMQFAQLDPMQQAQYGMFRGGQQTVNAGAGLLGVEDPMLQKASMLKQIASKYDYSTPEGLLSMSKELANNGFNEQATIAITRANELKKSSIDQALNTRKALSEGTSTEWVGVPGKPELKQQAIVDRISGKVTPIGSPISVFSNQQLINVDARGETEFSKQLGKNDANTVSAAMTTRQNAVNTIKSLDELSKLDNQDLYSGGLANERVAVGNFLDTLGLASKGDVKRISNSQQYSKVAGDVVLQTLGGKLGAGFSNDDRKFIEGLIPQLGTNAAARKQLINFMRTKNVDIIKETSDLENYAREKKGLTGFNYKLPKETLAPISTSTNNVDPALLKVLNDRNLLP